MKISKSKTEIETKLMKFKISDNTKKTKYKKIAESQESKSSFFCLQVVDFFPSHPSEPVISCEYTDFFLASFQIILLSPKSLDCYFSAKEPFFIWISE